MARPGFWARVAAGAVLGLLALVPLWLFVGIGWLTALAGALAAAIGFLGSYFVVSADRPDEGYEQVLFDKPNTIVAAVLLVGFALAGVGTGFLGGDEVPTTADRVHMLRADYQRAADAFTKDEANATDTQAAIAALREESDRVALELEALPEDDARAALIAANDALALAMDALTECTNAVQDECMNARLLAADAQAALQRYAASV